MAIYRPVSSIANVGLSIGNGILGGVTDSISSKLGGMMPATRLGKVGGALVGAGMQQASSEISRRVSSKVNSLAYSADKRLSKAKNSLLNTFGLGLFDSIGVSSQGLLDSGGLTMRDIYQIWQETDPHSLSRQNFYVIEVNDRSGNAPVSRVNGQKYSRFNLLCTDLSFSSFEMQNEPVNVGSVVLNKLTSNQPTELSLTLYDDMAGSIKKWAEQKSLMMTQSNGLVMPPINYIFDVRIIFGTNIDDDDYYHQIYTMQMGSMQHQLTRESVDIEKVQLQFTQFDTCMPSFAGV